MTQDLKALQARQEKAKKDVADLEAQIRAAHQANATTVYDQVVVLLGDSGQFFTLGQRNHIKRLLGDERAPRDRAPGRGPKYQLDNGLTWTGHGKKTSGFDAWANSAEGKTWRAANPGQPFPAYPNAKAKGTPPSPRPTPTPTPAPTPTPRAAKAAKRKTK